MAQNEFTTALKGTDEIEITVTGRASGHKISNPVWFVQEGETLYLLPVMGSDTNWYKNVLKSPTIDITAKGRKSNARAKPITDRASVHEIVEKFRAKYGSDQVKKYYSNFDVGIEVPLS